jgi:hypothetical protein
MYNKDSIQTVKDGEFPFYEKEEKSESTAKTVEAIPMGPGSNLDSDTIHGLQAVTAKVAGPNKLVATDKNGNLTSPVSGAILATSQLPSTAGGTFASNLGSKTVVVTNGLITSIV